MRYNLSPVTRVLETLYENTRGAFPQQLHSYLANTFHNKDYDKEVLDSYYDILISDIPEVERLVLSDKLVEPYTGLFTFDTLQTTTTKSFNLAYFIERNAPLFHGKRIFILNHDYGMVNIQAKFCGLNVVNTLQKKYLNVGSVLACIGNQGHPYPLNITTELPDYDVLIMSCVFQDTDASWTNWNYMVDARAYGKEVYFTSNTFIHLKNYVDYDRLQIMEHPVHIYKSDEYFNISYGYMNKIYQVR
jgi:hypothetical protein